MCCVKTKLESAKLCGVVLVLLSLCVCLKGDVEFVIAGLSAALIHSVLVCGTIWRNSSG